MRRCQLITAIVLAISKVAAGSDHATIQSVCTACEDTAQAREDNAQASVFRRFFGEESGSNEYPGAFYLPTKVSESCFSAVVQSCARYREAHEELDPARAMQVMAILTDFSYCNGFTARRREDVTVAQVERLKQWKQRMCGLHDEL